MAPPSAEAARAAVRKGLISVGLTLGALMLIALGVHSSGIGGASFDGLLHSARPGELVLALCLISLAFLSMALRWRALMPPQVRPPVLGLTAIITAGLLLNYAIPGPAGEFAAAWFAHRRYGVPLAPSLASGVAARIVGLTTASLLATAVWAVTELPVPPGYEGLVGISAVSVGLGGLLLALLAARPALWKGLTAHVLRPLHRFRRLSRFLPRLQAGTDALADALAETALRGPLAYARAASWALVGHSSVIVGILVGIHGLGASPDTLGVAFTYAITTSGAVLLFLLPGSQAGWDALFVSLLVWTAGLDWPVAISVGLLVRLQQLFFMVIGGIAVLWLVGPGRSPARAAAPKGGGAADEA